MMELKLLLRYILVYGISILTLTTILTFALADEDPEKLIRSQVLFALLLPIFEWFFHLRTGRKLGIYRGDENYLKSNFSECLESNLSEELLIYRLDRSNEYLGRVYLNDKLIRKNKTRLYQMSQSIIEVKKYEQKLRVKLSTGPMSNLINIDKYANYKCFKAIKKIITAEK